MPFPAAQCGTSPAERPEMLALSARRQSPGLHRSGPGPSAHWTATGLLGRTGACRRTTVREPLEGSQPAGRPRSLEAFDGRPNSNVVTGGYPSGQVGLLMRIDATVPNFASFVPIRPLHLVLPSGIGRSGRGPYESRPVCTDAAAIRKETLKRSAGAGTRRSRGMYGMPEK